MKRSELDAFLKSIDARPKKSLSQNFLIDSHTIQKIIDLAEVSSNDTILEIGPGPGALTKALLDTGALVYAVEFDSVFARELNRLQNGRLKVFERDFLKFPMPKELSNYKVVANLPYHITTPILEKIFSHTFSSMTIMVQKEVADRMVATPPSKDFGSLSVFVQFYSKYIDSFSVPPGSFYPKPKVDSTVLRLDSKDKPDVNEEIFFKLVRGAFQKRRKMLTSSLPIPKDTLRETLISIDIRPDARPENLSFEKWVALVKKLEKLSL